MTGYGYGLSPYGTAYYGDPASYSLSKKFLFIQPSLAASIVGTPGIRVTVFSVQSGLVASDIGASDSLTGAVVDSGIPSALTLISCQWQDLDQDDSDDQDTD